MEYEPVDDDYEPPARQRTGGGAGPGRKKNKPMTATEQERKIQALQGTLQQFEQGKVIPGATGGGSSEESPQRDSDDDDEDSESEEE